MKLVNKMYLNVANVLNERPFQIVSGRHRHLCKTWISRRTRVKISFNLLAETSELSILDPIRKLLMIGNEDFEYNQEFKHNQSTGSPKSKRKFYET